LISIGGVLTNKSPLIGNKLANIHEFGGRDNWLVTVYVRDIYPSLLMEKLS